MEMALISLFDYQKFEGNSDLQRIIDGVHARHSRVLLDADDVEFVAAARQTYLPDQPQLPRE